MKEKIAGRFQQQGDLDDAAISLFSAASCYKVVEQALTLTGSEEFVKEMQQFRNDCQRTLAPTGQRTLHGIVRNGAVHPFEPNVLTEGQLATISAV